MTTNNDQNQTTTPDATILDRSTVVSLRVGRLGIRRKVSSSRVSVKDSEAQPEAGVLKVAKEIIDCEAYDAIASLDNETRAKLIRLAVPWNLRAGSYLVPDPLLDRVDEALQDYQTRRAHLVDAFLDVYQAAQVDARAKLGPLFDAGDYPDPEQVREAFTVAVRFETYGAPSRLESLSQRIYHRERERVDAELRTAAAEVRNALRLAARDLVAHLVDVLQPGPDGKPKTFRNTTVDNLVSFLDTFSARNIAQDQELAAAVAQAREILNGSDPETLRRAPLIRTIVRDGLTQVRDRLAGLTETRGRRFTFGAPAAEAQPPAAPPAE